MGTKLYVAASLGRLSADLFLLDRSERAIIDKSLDVDGLHYTWRDGEKQHIKAESGDLADMGWHPDHVEAIREAWGNSRLWAAGVQQDWADLPDIHLVGSRIYHADELDRFPGSKQRPRVIRVDLTEGQHVEVAHYLIRPGEAAEDFLASLRDNPDKQLDIIDHWTPWSVVTTWRFDDHSFIRALSIEAESLE